MYYKPHLYTLKLVPSFSQNLGKSNTHFLPVVKINIILNNNKTKNTEFISNKTLKALDLKFFDLTENFLR